MDTSISNQTLKDLNTDKEFCDFLGVAPVTTWRMRRDKVINYRRVRGKIRYTREDIEKYLESCAVSAKRK
ncbi:MAG: helix-turn-helix domain-containing protein [Pyrinomonadaceae bacterium]